MTRSSHLEVKRAPRVATLVFLVSAIPMLGTIWFSSGELREAQQALDRTESVLDGTAEVVRVAELQARLLDERNWSLAINAADEVDVDLGVIRLMTGFDLETEQAEALADVDTYIEQMQRDDIAAVLSDLRNYDVTALADWRDSYDEAFDVLDQENAYRLEQIADSAHGITGSEDLIRSVRSLEYSLDARRAAATQLSSFFSITFSRVETARIDVASLIEDRRSESEALNGLTSHVLEGQGTYLALAAIRESEATARFSAEIDELIAVVLRGEEPLDVYNTLELSGVVTAASNFVDGDTSAQLHLELVEAAGEDILIQRDLLRAEATSRRTSAILLTLAILMLTLLTAGLIARMVVAPLAQLADTARSLRDGKQPEKLRTTGPAEVREAAAALNDAQAQLLLAEHQATALAEGRLDDKVLGESAAGQLGASLQAAVRTLTDSLNEREAFRQQLAHEAAHDGLTALANRKACHERLEAGLARTRRSGENLSVLFIDLDRFKQVNDHYGHPAGDVVLIEVAKRLSEHVRLGDLVGRIGGDEFVVVAEPVRGASEVMVLASRLSAAISAPIDLGYSTVSVGASIGIAITGSGYNGTALSADELLHDADLAVYKAKSSGRSCIELCNEDLRSQVLRDTAAEQALAEAVQGRELTIRYESVEDVATGAPVALEAVIEWEQAGTPEGLKLSQHEYLEIARRSDLIIEIERWALQTAVSDIRDGKHRERVGLHISHRHLVTEDFVERVAALLTEHGVDAERLVLTFSERDVLGDYDTASERLHGLKDLGVRAVIDDFGAGYNALGELRSLPIAGLKLDQRFTNDRGLNALSRLVTGDGSAPPAEGQTEPPHEESATRHPH